MFVLDVGCGEGEELLYKMVVVITEPESSTACEFCIKTDAVGVGLLSTTEPENGIKPLRC